MSNIKTIGQGVRVRGYGCPNRGFPIDFECHSFNTVMH